MRNTSAQLPILEPESVLPPAFPLAEHAQFRDAIVTPVPLEFDEKDVCLGTWFGEKRSAGSLPPTQHRDARMRMLSPRGFLRANTTQHSFQVEWEEEAYLPQNENTKIFFPHLGSPNRYSPLPKEAIMFTQVAPAESSVTRNVSKLTFQVPRRE